MNDFLNTGRKSRERSKAPRPGYRVVGNQANAYHGSFSTEGLEEISFFGGIEEIDSFNSRGYYDPRLETYSGTALVTLNTGKRLEVSVNGLGEKKAKQKIYRAVTQYLENLRLSDTRHWNVSQKRSQHKKSYRSRHK